MPLFFQQQLNEGTHLGVWKIAENENFFLAQVPLQRSITHPHKRLQHLAGRYLLKHLAPHFPLPLIQIADTRKPFLEDELFHFSISHCGDFAAAIVSAQNRVGVDLELVSDKIRRVQHKFVSDDEMRIVNRQWSIINKQTDDIFCQPSTVNHALTLIWSCKEAAFKWYGLGEVDFKTHMQLQKIESAPGKLFQISMLFKKEEDVLLRLQSRFFDELCLSYVVT